MTEAYRSIQEAGRSWKPAILTGKGETVSSPMKSRASSSKSVSRKVTASPRQTIFEDTGVISSDFLLHRLEEVKQSVKYATPDFLTAGICWVSVAGNLDFKKYKSLIIAEGNELGDNRDI
ncbi:hypothetical protein ACLOJK_036307 [Asimina triloba]